MLAFSEWRHRHTRQVPVTRRSAYRCSEYTSSCTEFVYFLLLFTDLKLLRVLFNFLSAWVKIWSTPCLKAVNKKGYWLWYDWYKGFKGKSHHTASRQTFEKSNWCWANNFSKLGKLLSETLKKGSSLTIIEFMISKTVGLNHCRFLGVELNQHCCFNFHK
mgnify:FL=1